MSVFVLPRWVVDTLSYHFFSTTSASCEIGRVHSIVGRRVIVTQCVYWTQTASSAEIDF